MQLNFLQSNWHRRYPFRAGHGGLDLMYNELATDIIVAMRVSCTSSDLELYIEKVYLNNGYVSVSVAGSAGPVGYANGRVTDNNTALNIVSYNGGVIGNVTIGNRSQTSTTQNYQFNSTNGLIEPSCVTVLPVPAVTALDVSGKRLTGHIKITSNTLSVIAGDNLSLSVNNPSSVQSRGDRLAKNLSCENTVITGINDVKPDATGNIDIYAISPMSITQVVKNGMQQLQLSAPGFDSSRLCKIVNIPPENTTTSYPDILTVTEPEWKAWPQYQ
jgi:hypothetical protein